jgi:hypothetical protein
VTQGLKFSFNPFNPTKTRKTIRLNESKSHIERVQEKQIAYKKVNEIQERIGLMRI